MKELLTDLAELEGNKPPIWRVIAYIKYCSTRRFYIRVARASGVIIKYNKGLYHIKY